MAKYTCLLCYVTHHRTDKSCWMSSYFVRSRESVFIKNLFQIVINGFSRRWRALNREMLSIRKRLLVSDKKLMNYKRLEDRVQLLSTFLLVTFIGIWLLHLHLDIFCKYLHDIVICRKMLNWNSTWKRCRLNTTKKFIHTKKPLQNGTLTKGLYYLVKNQDLKNWRVRSFLINNVVIIL